MTATPGQMAYETWRVQHPRAWLHERPLPWQIVDPTTRAEWEAVAQAVLALKQEEEDVSA